jgi:hypothetical protein
MRRSTSCPLVRAVFVFVFVIMLGPWSVAGAQSLIVGIPNAEATPKGNTLHLMIRTR